LSLSVFLPGSRFSRYIRGQVKILIIRNYALVGELPQDMRDEFRVCDVAIVDQSRNGFPVNHRTHSGTRVAKTPEQHPYF
jgi:hypothetical protein